MASESDTESNVSMQKRTRPPRNVKGKKFKQDEVTDPDGFKKPNLRKTAKSSSSPKQSTIPTSNLFDPLSDADSESSKASRKRKTPYVKSPGDPKPTKPIRIPSTSMGEIRAVLAALRLSKAPRIKKDAGNAFQIIPYSTEDKKKILEQLNAKSIGNFSHCEPDDRRQTFVLKKFHSVAPQELQKILNEQEIPSISVAQIGRSESDPTYLVSFEKNSISFDELFHQHKIIDMLSIRWEKFKPKKKRYVQCSNCQRWGHGKNNCNMPRRCVKCKEEHNAGECARKSPKDEGLPYCVNCNEHGHPANATVCTAYKKHIANIEKAKKKSQGPREFVSTPAPWASQNFNNNFPPLPTNVNQSNQLPKNTHEESREYRPPLTQTRSAHTQTQEKNDLLPNIQEEISGIPGMKDTMKLYRELIEKLKSNTNPREQLKVLFQFGLNNILNRP